MAYIQLPPSGGGSGAVDSVNGLTGVVVLTKSSIGLSNVDNTSDLNKPVSTATQTALNLKQDAISATNNQLLRQASPGVMDGAPGLSVDSDGGALRAEALREPDAGNYSSINYRRLDIEPLQNSPDVLYDLQFSQVNIDNNNSGFSQGTNGTAVRIHNNFINHTGTGDVGEVVFTNNSFTLGNGTDPIDVRGFSYSYGFGQVAATTNISGPMQGYGFQPSFASGSTIGASAYSIGFYDFANIDAAHNSHTSFSAGPYVLSIANNSNYTGLNINPQVDNFLGNASMTGIALTGNLGTFDTGNYQGVVINPSIDDVDNINGIFIGPQATTNVNATGLIINMNNVTSSGTKRAIDATGDVNINGSLSFSGALSIGELTAYYSESLVDGGGTPSSTHSLVSAPFVAASATVNNADHIGVNTASLMTFNTNSTVTTNLVGIAALALPAVVTTHTGSSVDLVCGATFAISLDGGSTGGTIDQVSLCRSTAIPNGITTVTDLIGYEFVLPFGDPGTNTWGFYAAPDVTNYFAGSVIVGPTDSPTNSSVGIEINGVTKALLNARMTTAERNALTAVNGMQIYNSTTDKLQVYAAGSWVDLH